MFLNSSKLLLIYFLISFLATYFAIYLLLPILRKYLIDIPNNRSSHSLKTPSGGGVTFIMVSTVFMFIKGNYLPIICLPLALIGIGTKWKIGSSFYISSLFGTAVTDISIFLTGIMDQWKEVITADSETAPLILQRTSENLIQVKALSIIFIIGLLLWFFSKEIFNFATINSINGKSLLVAAYVIQTTLIVDAIFIFLAFIQPTLSGLV